MYTEKKLCKTKLSIAIAGMACFVTGATSAQTVLEEIVVTAQKREQTLQDTPISIAVVSGENLDKFGITNADDFASKVPGLEILPAPQGQGAPAIRGLGSGSASQTIDQSVGLFIDGVWSGRSRDLQTSLFDIERVEVIKGSQTSQLGKNTSVGAIRVFSKRPDDVTGGYVSAEYETEFNSSTYTGALNLATDSGDYRLAFRSINEKSFVDNTLVDGRDDGRDQKSIRLSGQWELNDRASLFASYSYDDLEAIGTEFQVIGEIDNGIDGVSFLTASTDTDITADSTRSAFTTATNNGSDLDTQESQRAVIEFDYQINDNLQFKSLSGYSQYDYEISFDADFSNISALEQVNSEESEQFSQEFQINGNLFNDTFHFVAGVNYVDSSFDTTSDTEVLLNSILPASFLVPFAAVPDLSDIVVVDGGGIPVLDADGGTIPTLFALVGPSANFDSYEQDVETIGAYFNGTYDFTEKLSLTVGLRYTNESRDVSRSVALTEDQSFFLEVLGFDPVAMLPTFGPTTLDTTFGTLSTVAPLLIPEFTADLDRDEDNVDGSINLQYSFNDSTSGYVSWGRGSKSGGFSSTNDAAVLVAGAAAGVFDLSLSEFDTEVAETFEVGVKSRLLNGALNINGAIFSTDIDNFQVSAAGSGIITLTSTTVPVESKGIEVDALWAATENLTVGGSFVYTDSEDVFTGFQTVGAPEFSANLTLNHYARLGANYKLTTNASISYRDDSVSQLIVEGIASQVAPARALVDLRLALSPNEGNWELALLAKNLFDEQEVTFSFPAGGLALIGADATTGIENRPRTISLQATYKF